MLNGDIYSGPRNKRLVFVNLQLQIVSDSITLGSSRDFGRVKWTREGHLGGKTTSWHTCLRSVQWPIWASSKSSAMRSNPLTGPTHYTQDFMACDPCNGGKCCAVSATPLNHHCRVLLCLRAIWVCLMRAPQNGKFLFGSRLKANRRRFLKKTHPIRKEMGVSFVKGTTWGSLKIRNPEYVDPG